MITSVDHCAHAESPPVNLIRAAKGGCKESLAKLFLIERPSLLRYVGSRSSSALRSRYDASDVVQQTFIDAQDSIRGFRGESAKEFIGWLHMINRNNCKTAKSRHFALKRSPMFERDENRMKGAAAMPNDGLMQSETMLMVVESLHRLPPMQAEAVRLRYLGELSQAEIANRLGKTVHAVGGLLKRGLAGLRGDLCPTG